MTTNETNKAMQIITKHLPEIKKVVDNENWICSFYIDNVKKSVREQVIQILIDMGYMADYQMSCVNVSTSWRYAWFKDRYFFSENSQKTTFYLDAWNWGK